MDPCAWVEDSEEMVFDTSCGHTFSTMDGTRPLPDWIKFCCFCGRVVKFVPYEEEKGE